MEDARLAQLIDLADQSGLTVDLLEVLSRELDETAFAIFAGNVSMLPKYMKSSVMPYLSRSRIAPSIEMRASPLSQAE